LVLVHDVMAHDTIDPDYDIDTGIDTVLANVAARSTLGTRLPAYQWSELSSESRDLWQSLPEADRAIILGSTKAGPSKSPRPFRPSSSGGTRPPGGCPSSNQHLSSFLSEIAIEDDVPISTPMDIGTAPDPSPDDSPADTVLLAHVTKQQRTWTQPRGSDLPPSDIRKVLSNDSTRKNTQMDTSGHNEITVDQLYAPHYSFRNTY
jgi:hypothetical protein